MSSDTFFNELGVEPYGYVGQDSSGDQASLVVYNAIHAQIVPEVIPIGIIYVGKGAKHRLLATSIEIQQIIPSESLSAIHRVKSPNSDFKFILSVYNAIHTHYFLDKWNAHFSYDCSRYLDTPYQFRLVETKGCDIKCDPSILPDDPAGQVPGSSPVTDMTHNELLGLQGGVQDQYYHLTLAERNKLATSRAGSVTFVSRFQPASTVTGDGWVNPETRILEMYYDSKFNGVSVDHSTEADEVDGGHF